MAELEAAQAAEDEDYGIGLEATYGDVGVTFQIFGDVGFAYENPEPPGQGNSAFFFGAVDFFINARFGENFLVLSETVVDGKPLDAVDLSQERLWLSWTPRDSFYAKIGTEHAPISRWNQLYHHGAWLETTIDRPIPVRFEGGSGILPLHRTGVTLGGSTHHDAGRFEYFATVSNGRGPTPDNKQRAGDANNSKAIDVGLAFEPAWESSWRFGVAAVWDEIPPDPGSPDPQRAGSMAEWIGAANVEAREGPWRLLSEWFYIDHEVRSNDQHYSNNAGYVQLEYAVDGWTPYTRFGYRAMNTADPFYGAANVTGNRNLDTWLQTVGVRRELTPNVALKIEAGYGREDESATSTDERSVAVAGFQLSWWL